MTNTDNTYPQFVTIDAAGNILWSRITMCMRTYDEIREDVDLCSDENGRYVRAWTQNGRDTWQVCDGGSRMGSTLTWHGATVEARARNFARAVGARFYKTEVGFERAIAKALQAAQ